MRLEDQCVEFELSSRLSELGINQNSLFCWQPIKDEQPSIWPRSFNLHEFVRSSSDQRIAAFTVAELGEILPVYISTGLYSYEILMCVSDEVYGKDFDTDEYVLESPRLYQIGYKPLSEDAETIPDLFFTDENEANIRANCLIYLIENRLMELPK